MEATEKKQRGRPKKQSNENAVDRRDEFGLEKYYARQIEDMRKQMQRQDELIKQLILSIEKNRKYQKPSSQEH